MIVTTPVQDNSHDDASAYLLDARPLVSVCIANYNGETFIRECIDSVLNQTASPSFEIIVHDDASTDSSLDQITAYPMVRVIRSAANVGYCVANNRMATAARGAYILLLNNDTALKPDALSTLMASATTMSTPAILGLRQYDYHSRSLIDAGAWLDFFMSPIPTRRDEPTHPAMVIGACLWIPRPLWNELGGFPEWFHTNAEDVYLCCAARMRGYDIFVPNASGYLHRVGATLSNRSRRTDKLTTTVRRRYLSERNRTRLMLMFYPWPLLIVALILQLSTLLIEGIVVAAANRDSKILTEIYMRAMHDVEWRSLKLSAARRQIAATRQISFCAFLSRFRVIPSKIHSVIRLGLPRVR